MEDHDIKTVNSRWIVPKKYKEIVPIGIGAYGQVCSAIDCETNKKVAIKKLARPFESDVNATRTYRELRLLKHMNHENVIGLLDVFTSAKTIEDFKDLYFVTHLMEADLNNIIQTQIISDIHVQFLVYQILRGLKYIHSAGIIHRDLKPSNIGISKDWELKILDFGLARPTETDNMTEYVATRWYRAPEIMLNWSHYNETVDIWSVGCIMAELLTGKPLFPGNNYVHQLHLILDLLGSPSNEHMHKISNNSAKSYVQSLPVREKKDFCEVFETANSLAIKLLEEMLSLDADNRMTAEKALMHPYVAYYADPQNEPKSEPYDELYEGMEFDLGEWKKLVWEEMTTHVPLVD